MKRVYPYSVGEGPSQNGSFIITLAEPDSARVVPIFIGRDEAQSILLALKMISARRPLTHELMQHVMEDFGLTVTLVTIDRVVEGIFYSTVHVTDGFNEKLFDSRTSDAINMAILWACPIMMDENVLAETSAPLSPDAASPQARLAALEKELHQCELSENYERAAEVQQQIELLKQQNPTL